MKPNTPMGQLFFVGALSSLLIACGGEDDPNPTPDPYVQQFHPLLPLSVGASISYFDTASGDIESMQIYDDALSSSSGEDIYQVTFDSSEKSLSFYFASTPDSILVYGIDGPINVSGNGLTYQLDELRFNQPLTLKSPFTNNPTGSTIASATIQIGNSSALLDNINIQYQTLNLDTQYEGGYGTLPVTAAFFNASVETDVNVLGQNISIDETITNTLLFTKGIGIVRHTGTYVSEAHTYNSEITTLNNLPNTIWYNRNNGNPSLASGSSNTFQMAGLGTIHPNDYALVNLEDINDLGWISLQQNNNNYRVSMDNNGSLPTETTAVEVVFEHKVTERRVSASVILLAP